MPKEKILIYGMNDPVPKARVDRCNSCIYQELNHAQRPKEISEPESSPCSLIGMDRRNFAIKALLARPCAHRGGGAGVQSQTRQPGSELKIYSLEEDLSSLHHSKFVRFL